MLMSMMIIIILITYNNISFFFSSLDCQNIDFFSKETHSQNLYTLKISDNVLTKIPYKGKSGWTNCEVHLNSSWVLGCNGQKLQQSLGYLRKIRELFVIFRRRGSRKFRLQVRDFIILRLFSSLRYLLLICSSIAGQIWHRLFWWRDRRKPNHFQTYNKIGSLINKYSNSNEITGPSSKLSLPVSDICERNYSFPN